MNKLGRFLFYALVLMLWAVLFAAALEGWTRWNWRRIETRNPFVISRTQHKLWPIERIPEHEFSERITDTEFRDQRRGQGKSPEPLPQPAPEEELLWRFPAFLAQDDFGRLVFSNVYGLDLFLLDHNGEMHETYAFGDLKMGDTLAKFVHVGDIPGILEAAREQASNGEPHRFLPAGRPDHVGPFGYCLFFPEDAGDGRFWLAAPRQESWQPLGVDTIWELPFFTYQKHVERKDRISALGITEDFYINNYGFRDADLRMPKPEGTFRILCVGASTTEEGPINDLTYPAILETLLNDHFDFNRVDVVNCGISGMNSLKHRMRIGDYLALEPDLIVLYNAVNDICHDLYTVWINEATPLQRWLRESRFVCRYFGRRLLPDEARLRADIVNTKMSNLAVISRHARERGVPVAVCSFAAPYPDRLSPVERDYYEYYTVLEWTGRYSNFDSYLLALGIYNDALRQLCRDEDLLYIPVEENMREGAILFGDICHLRNPGIEKKAGIIAEALIPLIEQAL